MTRLRNRVLAVCCAALAAGCNSKIDYRQLQENNGLTYKAGESDPFSGTVVNLPLQKFVPVGGDGSCTAEMAKGLPDGAVECKTGDGKKIYEAHWHQGQKDGKERVWNAANGNPVAAQEWANGRKSGLEQRFNPDLNKVVTEINWADGKKLGRERYWDVRGDTVLVDVTWQNGKQSGFRKVGEWEESYVDGELDGVRRRYEAVPGGTDLSSFLADDRLAEQIGGVASAAERPGFRIALEEHYLHGKLEGTAKSWHSNGTLWEESQYKGGKRIAKREWDDKGTLRRESYFEPDNQDLPSINNGEAAYRTFDSQGKLVETSCWRNDCSGLDRVFSGRTGAVQTTATDSGAPAVSSIHSGEHVGQCVFPKTNVAKDGRLEFKNPILLLESPGAKDGVPLKALTAFKVQGENGLFVQLADKETGKVVGWSRLSDFEMQDLRNCNI